MDLKHIPKNTALQMLKSWLLIFDKVSRYSLAEGNVAMRRCPKRDADMSQPFLCSPVSVKYVAFLSYVLPSFHSTLPHYRTKVTWPSKTMGKPGKTSFYDFTQVLCWSDEKLTNTFSQLTFNKGLRPFNQEGSSHLAEKYGLFMLIKGKRPSL